MVSSEIALSSTCSTIPPGQPLHLWQKLGLELVSLFEGRDVILAIDLTESVGLNNEGRIRLAQIVEDSLQRGDSVYVVAFATSVYPPASVVEFQGQQEDINQILEAIPFQANLNLQNADIQGAELFAYQKLAQLNQCRLVQDTPIKHQSVVWITDAPLMSQSGADWIETPAKSPFRVEDSPETQLRQEWIQTLPLQARSRQIVSDNNEVYQLSVVDVAPTVQEFCTPAPGGKETCLVTPYLIGQLWLPASTFLMVLLALGFFFQKRLSRRKKWQLLVDLDDQEEEQICYLQHNQRIAIGEDETNSIDCPGSEIRAYLERRRNQLYLIPTQEAPIYCNGQEVNRRTLLSGSNIRLNCPDGLMKNYEYELVIRVRK